ncbi:hypothetical protein VNO77_31116 [Canavalia gladiata]|uniref:Uncharacterized protein n=1 Tax=Canavalia gladiata TaxID=3824 RepID=A0AAN9KS69_CANGL
MQIKFPSRLENVRIGSCKIDGRSARVYHLRGLFHEIREYWSTVKQARSLFSRYGKFERINPVEVKEKELLFWEGLTSVSGYECWNTTRTLASIGATRSIAGECTCTYEGPSIYSVAMLQDLDVLKILVPMHEEALIMKTMHGEANLITGSHYCLLESGQRRTAKQLAHQVHYMPKSSHTLPIEALECTRNQAMLRSPL